MAGAEGGFGADGAGGEAHHEQTVGGGPAGGDVGRGVGDWWGGVAEEELAEVLFMEDDVVVGERLVVGTGHEFGADGDLGGQTDDGGADV